MWVYRTQWQLPGGFKCDQCKLQWTWTTGHSCWPTCEAGNPSPQCWVKQPYGACGQGGTAYPEEFVNCADVKVVDNAKIDVGANNYPPWGWAVDKNIKKGWWGSIKPSVLHEGW